jgi:FkbM family methyltransferase
LSLESVVTRWTRRVPAFRGWYRLLEPFRRASAQRWAARDDRWTVLDDFQGDLRMRVDRGAYMGSLIHWRGIHAAVEAGLLRRFLPPDGVFVDVGANQGELTLVGARLAPRGRVVAFEPVPHWHERLVDNVALNAWSHVTVVRAALADREGVREMFTGDGGGAEGGANEGLSSLHRGDGRQRSLGTVEALTLDAYVARTGLDRLDVLKVDVEGGEHEVLAGARAVLARFRPVLIVEWSPAVHADVGRDGDALLDELRALGYRLHEVNAYGRVRALGPSERPRLETLLALHGATR